MRKTGLREKPSYDQLISEIDVDQLVGYPDRRAKGLIDSPYLSNLFNNESIDLEDQAQLRQKHEDVERYIRGLGFGGGGGGGGGPRPPPPPGAPPAPPSSAVGAAANTANVLRAIYQGVANRITGSNPQNNDPIDGNDGAESFYSVADSAGHLQQQQAQIMDLEPENFPNNLDAHGRLIPTGASGQQVLINQADTNNPQPMAIQNNDFWLSNEGPDTSNTASQLALVIQNSGTQNFDIGTPRPNFQVGGSSGSGPQPVDRLAHVEDRGQEADFMYGVRKEKKKTKKDMSLEAKATRPSPIKKPGVPPKKKDNIPTSQMGTSKEYGNKNMFMSKSRGYLIDQLSLRGFRLKKDQMKTKGQGAMSKKELVDTILAKDGLVNV